MADERTKIQLERELARERRLRELADERAVKMRQLAQFNENTMSAYNVLFSSLLGD